MRDGMAYALKNFNALLSQAKYPLLVFVIALVLCQWRPFMSLLPALCAVWLQAAFIHQQRQRLFPSAAPEAENRKSWRDMLVLWGRVLAVTAVQASLLGGTIFLLLLAARELYVMFSAYLHAPLLFFTAVGLLAVLCFVVVLYVAGVLRLLYMQHVYTDGSFPASVRQLRNLHRYIGRTMALEMLLWCVSLLIALVFVTPLQLMSHINDLSMGAIKMDGTDVPSYFVGLLYLAVVLAALGSAFAALLSSYPMCYNYLSIQIREAEREQQ